MKNKKEILIEMLHGSLCKIEELPDMMDGMTIYNESGYVDLYLMTELIEYATKVHTVTERLMRSLGTLLGCDFSETDKKGKKKDDGAKWDVVKILQHCTLEDNVMKLPNVQFNKKSYIEAKQWIEEAGGHWNGGNIQGFSFEYDAKRVFERLHSGQRCNLAQEYQFFGTPKHLADMLAYNLGDIKDAHRVLEPSAGRGALIDAIHRVNPSVTVDCYELMPENREILASKKNVRLVGEDFIKEPPNHRYDLIIANPPFKSNQDIDHVMAMYECLEDGGAMSVITSCHWTFAQEKKCAESVDAMYWKIDAGEFKESGTGIETMMIAIQKPKNR